MAKITITTNDGIVADIIEDVNLGDFQDGYNISKPITRQLIMEQIIEAVTWAVKEELEKGE